MSTGPRDQDAPATGAAEIEQGSPSTGGARQAQPGQADAAQGLFRRRGKRPAAQLQVGRLIAYGLIAVLGFWLYAK